MHWQTIYNIADVNHTSHVPAWEANIGSFCFFLLIFFVLATYSIRKYAVPNAAERKRLITEGAIFIFFCLFLILSALFIHKGFSNKLLDYYNSGRCKTVDGIVEHFSPGRISDEFTVNNYKFVCCECDATNPGFCTTRKNGGPIKDGLHVKIWFVNRDNFGGYYNIPLGNMVGRLEYNLHSGNTIARLDIAEQNNIPDTK